MLTRSFSSNGQFDIADWTQEVNVIPNDWGTIGNLKIFEEESTQSQTVQFEEIIKDGAVIVDRVRGDRTTVGRDYKRKIHTFNVPHFPLDDYILPEDLVGKRAYGSTDEADKLDLVRTRKLERIRRSHAMTLEAARAQAITQGTVYAPSGTVTQDWYQEFTQAARPAAVDFLLGTPSTDIMGSVETCIAAIQDNSGSVTFNGIVALCSPTWFSRFIAHSKIVSAYQFYASTQDLLRSRLAANGSVTAMNREFSYGGVRFIEMRDTYNGTPLIPVGDAYFLPTGTEFFKTYFSPANRFGIINTMGEQVYVFESMNTNGTAYTIESESNHISALLKPLLVIRATSSN